MKLAQMAKRAGNDPLAKQILTELEKEYPTMDYLSQAKETPGPAPSAPKTKYSVGVILPLSGPYQLYG